MTGSSNETIGSCNFEIDNLTVFTGVVEDNPSLGFVLNEDELLQKKENINSKEGETIMSHMKELVIIDDKEELACLIGQEKNVGQNLRTVTVMENQNSILIKDEDTMFEEVELIARINQGGAGQLLKIAKKKKKDMLKLNCSILMMCLRENKHKGNG